MKTKKILDAATKEKILEALDKAREAQLEKVKDLFMPVDDVALEYSIPNYDFEEGDYTVTYSPEKDEYRIKEFDVPVYLITERSNPNAFKISIRDYLEKDLYNEFCVRVDVYFQIYKDFVNFDSEVEWILSGDSKYNLDFDPEVKEIIDSFTL